MSDDYLFSAARIDQVIQRIDQFVFDKIDRLPEQQLLGTPPVELATYFAEKYAFDLPQLHEQQTSVDREETQVDVSRDPSRHIRDRSRPILVPATKFKYFIPFEGDGEFFSYQGNRISLNPPRARVQGKELVLTYEREDHDGSIVKAEFDRDFGQIRALLANVVELGEEFNGNLHGKALARINARRERLQKSASAVAELGYPMRRREGVAQTYTVPEVKRKLPPTLPPSRPAAAMEPVLAEAEYEHILKIMSNMVSVIERTPETFRKIGEENLRQHFLIQLNGQYEGKATGETFNGSGKTDILIRERDKNIFIAECKFWKGPKSFNDAIDQLLGYATWRDTKVALLIFNRGGSLSGVLEKIPGLVKKRPECVREIEQSGESRFRFILKRLDDADRELIVTVMVFEVPEGPSKSGS